VDGKFLKPYNPKETEGRIYSAWEKSGFFNPDNCVKDGHTAKDAKSFTIIMPPTNANGSLHAGHGLVMTIEDIITRYKRMSGYKTLWLPGLDHAGFETQVVYEKKLEKEGKSRFDFEREQLYKDILKFTLDNSNNIKSQIRSTGASCDWSREKFTLDDDVVKIVYQTFKKLYDDKLLYRGKRIVSWCPKHQTSFADIEIKDEEKVEPYYYLKYGPFTISTSRPETKFGDKYVVMHPEDKRYADYKEGQKIDLEWINGPITATVIKDSVIDMEFGTGVMTITPWHDAVDFSIAERHSLDKEQIIDEKGKLLPIAGEFAGQHITKARPLIIEKLKNKGLVL
jgi:valyl-tRNA synthetase